MEKNLNLFSMRIKEWYAWHFPELSKIVPDNKTYVRCVIRIQDKDKLDEADLGALEEIIGSGDIAKDVLENSRHSVGQPNNDVDM